METATPTILSKDEATADFVFIDTANGGLHNRNHVIPKDEYKHPGPGMEDCFKSVFCFSNDILAHLLNNGYSVRGYSGAALATFLPFDFDSKEDPARAVEDANVLVKRLIRSGVPPEALRIFWSGNKGISIEVPATLFGGFPPSVDIHLKLEALASKLAAGLETLDTSIYKKVGLWRVPNTLHGKSGLYKIPLTPEELEKLFLDEIWELARKPRGLDLADGDTYPPVPALVSLKDATGAVVEHPSESGYKERFDTAAALAGVPEGDRDNTLFKYACSLRGQRRPIEEAKVLVLHAAANCTPPVEEAVALKKVDNAYRRYDAPSTTSTPEFPIEALPDSCRRLACEAADAIGCPVDFVAVPMLAVLGSAVGTSRVALVRSGWEEYPAFYCGVVADPGSGKSPAQKVAADPVYKAQSRATQEYERIKKEYDSLPPGEKKQRKEPTLNHVYTSNSTVEALHGILKSTPHGVLSNPEELEALVAGLNQYKPRGGSDQQFYQSVWSGVDIKVDRKGSDEPLIISHPYLSIVGGIQPDVLDELKGKRHDGFADRFLLSYPEPHTTRWTETEITQEAKDAYHDLYNGLAQLKPGSGEPYRLNKEEPESYLLPRRVGFTPEALALFSKEYDRIHAEMEAEGFPERLKGVWAKHVAYLARFSLLLAICRQHEETGVSVDRLTVDSSDLEEEVTVDGENSRYIIAVDVKNAIKLIEYFQGMAQKVYTKPSTCQPVNDSLADDLKAFVEESGGYWEGETSDLLDDLEDFGCDALPESPEALGKHVTNICRRSPALSLQRSKKKNDAGQVRRRLEITVNPSTTDEE